MDLDELLKGEYFQKLQEEIYLHIKSKKHGKLMALGFWDMMLRDAKARAAYVFLAVRDWPMVMEKCKPYVKAQFVQVLESPEAVIWYDQFISVVNHEYESRTAPQSAPADEAKAAAPAAEVPVPAPAPAAQPVVERKEASSAQAT